MFTCYTVIASPRSDGTLSHSLHKPQSPVSKASWRELTKATEYRMRTCWPPLIQSSTSH